jgi:UDP-N-acetylglucosamine--N-acetylmuramyl-(pentapeptide) pyrophosphoryl-undecaprenol N-acetylglucosamine transferase
VTTRIAFTGGGTAGHVYPALAVIDALGPGWDVSWIGSARGMERDLVHEAGLRYHGIPSGKWRRYLSLSNAVDMLRVIGGLAVAVAVLLRERPALLFSKGGYVTVPPVVAARMLGIPVITHESDTDPGLATRINARFAQVIVTSFEGTGEWFPREQRGRVVNAGNPVREIFHRRDAQRGRTALGVSAGVPVVLVLGGSLGSEGVNRLVRESVPRLVERCVVVHQTGARDFAPAPPDLSARYRPVPFFHAEIADVIAAADLVVARAGANTLAELAVCGAPCLLLPLELSQSRGDQVRNAAYFETRGAAEVFRGSKAGDLCASVLGLLDDPGRRRAMSAAIASLAVRDAAARIAAIIREHAR